MIVWNNGVKSKKNQVLFGLWGGGEGGGVQAYCIQVRGVLLIILCPTFVHKQMKPFPNEYNQLCSFCLDF